MSSDVHRLRAMASNLQDRIKTVGIVYPIVTALCFFVSSYIALTSDANYLDRLGLTFVGFVFGRMFSTLQKLNLEERRTIIACYLDLHDLVNKAPATPETRPAPTDEVSEAVAKVEIPAEPKLPDIPSVAAPAEVTAALKAGKGKGKPTKLPSKRKPKTVPPAQA